MFFGGKPGLKGVPGGRNELQVVPRVDFDIVEWISTVLEGWEVGNRVYIGNTGYGK